MGNCINPSVNPVLDYHRKAYTYLFQDKRIGILYPFDPGKALAYLPYRTLHRGRRPAVNVGKWLGPEV
jgi:hypothetical protein